MTREEARQWFLKVYSEIKGKGYADENEEAYEMAIKALEQEPCDDVVSRKAVIQTLNKMDRYTATELTLCDTDKKFPANEVFIVDDVYEQIAEQLPPVRPKEQKWIPVTTRPMTEEEKERHREQLEYVDDAVIFNCPLPDDGQEVLITVYGETELDTFYNDAIDGCYFENRDIEDVIAWMPLPEPYEPQERSDKE